MSLAKKAPCGAPSPFQSLIARVLPPRGQNRDAVASGSRQAGSLSREYVASILDYHPETGTFQWKHRADMDAAWNGHYAGKIAGSTNHGYVRITINGLRYFAHRLAWLLTSGSWPENQIDHINGDTSDNRIANLRSATLVENNHNRGMQSNNTSGFTGVVWVKHAKSWRAKIDANGKTVRLGYFKTAEDAYSAYLEAKKQHHSFQPVPRYLESAQ